MKTGCMMPVSTIVTTIATDGQHDSIMTTGIRTIVRYIPGVSVFPMDSAIITMIGAGTLHGMHTGTIHGTRTITTRGIHRTDGTGIPHMAGTDLTVMAPNTTSFTISIT